MSYDENFGAFVLEALYDLGNVPTPVAAALHMIYGISSVSGSLTMAAIQNAELIETLDSNGNKSQIPVDNGSVQLTNKGRQMVSTHRVGEDFLKGWDDTANNN